MRFAVWLLVVAGCSFTPVSPGGSAIDSAVPDDGVITGDTAGPPDAFVPLDGPACPTGFAPIFGAPSNYKIIATAATYDAAVATCAGLGPGSHLLEVSSQAEADSLEIALDLTFAGADTHLYRVLGKRPNTSSTAWARPDGSLLTFFLWGDNEPTNSGGDVCIVLRKESGNGLLPRVMGADQCSGAHEYACECE